MKKIDRRGLEKLSEAAANIESTYDELDTLFAEFETEATRLFSEINGFRQDAALVLEEAATDAESYFDERSEKWQDSDKGGYYAEWRDGLRRLADEANEDIDAPEIETPERPDWVGEITSSDFASEFEDDQ